MIGSMCYLLFNTRELHLGLDFGELRLNVVNGGRQFIDSILPVLGNIAKLLPELAPLFLQGRYFES